MSSSAAQIQSIADELEIRTLVARFADSCTPPNYENFSKLWLPDSENKAVWSLSAPFVMSATGVDDIMAMLDKLLGPREFFVQLVHSGVVTLEGDSATGRWILREIARGPGETYYNNFAVYDDEYRKADGKWYFSKRHYNYVFLDDSTFQGTSFNITRK